MSSATKIARKLIETFRRKLPGNSGNSRVEIYLRLKKVKAVKTCTWLRCAPATVSNASMRCLTLATSDCLRVKEGRFLEVKKGAS